MTDVRGRKSLPSLQGSDVETYPKRKVTIPAKTPGYTSSLQMKTSKRRGQNSRTGLNFSFNSSSF
jgi:hypothetical protein